MTIETRLASFRNWLEHSRQNILPVSSLPFAGGCAAASHVHAVSDVSGLLAALAEKATPADIEAALSALVDSSPTALDTLNELAVALGEDPNFATTITNALAAKAATDLRLLWFARIGTLLERPHQLRRQPVRLQLLRWACR